MSSAVLVVGFGGSSPSFKTMTFFSSFAHQRVPFFNLKSGEKQAGHDKSVNVAP